MDQMEQLHVTIIGAGLGGLCLAQGLLRAGIPFDVYERDAAPHSRTQGYRIRIDAMGQQALAECLPEARYALFRATCAASASAGRCVDPQLAALDGRAADNWSPSATDEGDGDLSAHRMTLREILMQDLGPRLHFGQACVNYTPVDDGSVIAHFADGSTRRTRVLVAADGVHSMLRRRAWPDAEPRATGTVCLYGRTPFTPALRTLAGDDLGTGTTVIGADGFAAVLDAMRFRAPFATSCPDAMRPAGLSRVDDYLYWAFIGSETRLARVEPVGRRAGADVWLHSVDHWTRDWQPRVRRLLRHAEPDSIALQPVRRAPALGATPPPAPLAFLGDAIHVMSPAGGVGANTALADAADLVARLAAARAGYGAGWPVALRDYYTALRKRANAAMETADQAALKLFGSVLGVA